MRHRSPAALLSLLAASCAGAPAAQPVPEGSDGLFDLLDSDRDGALSPFEALDVLLEASQEGALTRDTLRALLERQAEEELAERRELFELGDSDLDGRLDLEELPAGFASMMSSLDADGDGAIGWSELREADLDSDELLARSEGAALHAELVEELGAPVRLEGAPPDLLEELGELDLDGDGVVTSEEAVQLIREELAGAEFEVTGEVAIMRGVIGARTPARVLELAVVHPQVRTLVLAELPGSIDDVANVRAGRYIRQLGLDTHVPGGGEVASGGTDLFLAGNRRTAAPDARFGIHSWGGGPVEATELPRDHEQHRLYLDYYEDMGIPAAFYWRTLSAAPPEDIHWMTEEELERFGFFTDGAADEE